MIRAGFTSLASRASSTLLGAVRVSPAATVAVRQYADDANLMKTPLWDFHVANGGRQFNSFNNFETFRSQIVPCMSN